MGMAEFWYKYLFLMGVAELILIVSVKFPVRTVSQSALWTSFSYENKNQSHAAIGPVSFALTVFVAFNIGLGIIWLIYMVNSELLGYIYTLVVAIILWQFAMYLQIIEKSKGRTKTVILVTSMLIVTSTIVWRYLQIWIVGDIFAVIAGYVILNQVGTLRLRYILAIFIPLVIYDVIGVSVTGAIVTIAGIGNANGSIVPPGIITVPANILSPFAQSAGVLGLADIIIPGLVVLAAKRFNLEKETLFSYTVGLFVLLIFLAILRRPLPATLLLNPVMILSVVIAARLRRVRLEW